MQQPPPRAPSLGHVGRGLYYTGSLEGAAASAAASAASASSRKRGVASSSSAFAMAQEDERAPKHYRRSDMGVTGAVGAMVGEHDSPLVPRHQDSLSHFAEMLEVLETDYSAADPFNLDVSQAFAQRGMTLPLAPLAPSTVNSLSFFQPPTFQVHVEKEEAMKPKESLSVQLFRAYLSEIENADSKKRDADVLRPVVSTSALAAFPSSSASTSALAAFPSSSASSSFQQQLQQQQQQQHQQQQQLLLQKQHQHLQHLQQQQEEQHLQQQRNNGRKFDKKVSVEDDMSSVPMMASPTNTKKWSQEEDERLLEGVKRFKEGNWIEIANFVKTKTNSQCLQRYRRVLRPGLVHGHFTEEEDTLIKMLVQEQLQQRNETPSSFAGVDALSVADSPDKINWSKIQESGLSHRSLKQIRERWMYNLSPSVNKAPFSDKEDNFILAKQLELGNKWSQISKSLPGRTHDLVKGRFNSLSHKIRKKFTPKDDKTLKELMAKPNVDWNAISAALAFKFSVIELKIRARQLAS